MLRFETECPRCGKKEEYQCEGSEEKRSIEGILQEKLKWDYYPDHQRMICSDCSSDLNAIHTSYDKKISKIEKRFDKDIEKLKQSRDEKIDELEREKDEKLDKFWPI